MKIRSAKIKRSGFLHIFRKFSTVQKNAPLYFCTPPSRSRSAKIKPECKNKAQRFFAYIQEIQHGAKKRSALFLHSSKPNPECKNKAQRFFAYIQEIQHGAKKRSALFLHSSTKFSIY